MLPGGGSAQAAELMRQAALRTPGADERARRLLRAVELELAAGYPGTAQEWLDEAEPWLRDQREQARALGLTGAVRYARGDLDGTTSLLLEAAGRLAACDPNLARATFLEAFQAAIYAGRLAGQVDTAAVASAVLSGPLPPERATAAGALLEGFATLLSLGYARAVPLLRGAIELLLESEPTAEALRWMMLGCLAAGEIWDNTSFTALVTNWVRGAREYGLFTALAVALNYQAWCDSQSGLLAAAGMSCAEENENLDRHPEPWRGGLTRRRRVALAGLERAGD